MSVSPREIASQRRQKFTIVQLMIFTAIVGGVLAPSAIWGSEGVPISCVLGIFVFAMWMRSFWPFLGGLLLIILLADMLAIGNPNRGPAKRTMCSNNMRQIVLALHNYQSANGKFPPPYTVDANGKPLHSWRVLILPYLECGDLYEAINLTKPWDDPVNLKFAQQMPDVFRCHSYQPNRNDKIPDAMTTYLAVVGEETIWHPNVGGLSFEDVTDGSSHTIMILESVANRVNWMSPQDLSFGQIVDDALTGTCNLPDSNHPGGGQVALIDGSCQFVPATKTAASMKTALTIAGSDETDLFDY